MLRGTGPIIEVACWAHCRRKIFDVWETTKSPVAQEALDRIAAFYAIEAKARFAAVEKRLEHRAATAPLLDPSFTAPIYANLFDDDNGDTFTLLWSRTRKPTGE